MDDHLLVPYDGSPLAERSLERAITAHPDARISVLYVIDPVGAVYEAEARGITAATEWHDRMETAASEICAGAESLAADHDCVIETTVETGSPAREILEFIRGNDVDHVIMGSHARSGVSRLILGSVAEQVMRQSPVPVTIVR